MKINEKEMKFVDFGNAERREERYFERCLITYVSYPDLFVPTDILVDRYADKMKIYIPFCNMLTRLSDINQSYHLALDDESRFYSYCNAVSHLHYCYGQLDLMYDLSIISNWTYDRIHHYVLSFDRMMDDWLCDLPEELWTELRVLSGLYLGKKKKEKGAE